MTIGTRRIALALLAGIALMGGAGVWFWPRPVQHSIDYKIPGNPSSQITAAKAAALERKERVIDQTVWVKEMQAQEHGRVFEDFWDALNTATNKWEAVERFSFERMMLGRWETKESLGHGIERWIPGPFPVGDDVRSLSNARKRSETPHVVSYAEWMERIRKLDAAGWRVMQCEFRHNAFDPQTNEVAAKSRFYFSVHLTNASPARAVVEGDLMVHWMPRETNRAPAIRQIDASRLQVLFRPGPSAFSETLTETLDPPDLTSSIEPLLIYDLDHDGIPEIALPSANRLYRRRGDRYEVEKFCSTPRLQILNGLFADFDGDGVTDFLYTEFDGVFLLNGGISGRFDTAPRLVAGNLEVIFSPRAVTCGDIDGDADLDVFVGQYKGPFDFGSMPTPYYDANDGYPSYLFLNDGAGNLKEATVASGLGAKRFRRVYAASFVDLDADGALDLVVTSDFAGVDVYRNDGRGHFTDVTSRWLDEAHAFGMGHAFGDFNNDAKLDFYVTGMTSPTADRLEHLGLTRASSKIDPSMRAKMSFGSRLYLQQDQGGFVNGAGNKVRDSSRRLLQMSESVARSGWSWGTTAADFDNDGWQDLYVANGMESMKKVRDYEREFWLHDIFVANSEGTEVGKLYFKIKGSERRRAWESFGGFEKNRLYLNREGKDFVNVAHLLGVALEDDCRNLVAADLNADGRVDLVLTSQHALPPVKEKLRVFINHLPSAGNWIAFQFREEPGHLSPIAAQVTLHAGERMTIGAVVHGDSFRSQHPSTVRFGLGKTNAAQGAEIRWPGGAVTRLAGLQVNQTHPVRPPKR